MAGPKTLVAPPAFTPRDFGLLSVVQDRSATPTDQNPAGPSPDHWRNGVIFQEICGLGSNTYDPFCLPEGASNTPAAKADNIDFNTYAARPFTVFAEVDCSPTGFSEEEQRARAVDALTRIEPYQVEATFWTGTAGGDADKVYPRLAANSAVFDTGLLPLPILQCAATTVTGSTVLDIVEAVGRLEAAWGRAGYNGKGVLHVPADLGGALFDKLLVKADGAQLKTDTGNLVAIGAGYPGTSPAGVATPNVVWIYMTPPIFMYRGAPETFRFSQMFDRENNTLKTIVERTYVLGYPCCALLAAAVSVGGDVTGQPLSAF